MKRLIPVILTSLVLLIGHELKAQTFSELLTQSEQIKAKYGETDDRYLDALSKAIQAAFEEQNNEQANKYRIIHSDIVKEKYGEMSLEYAEDIWRLGNVSEFKGESFQFDCYRKVQRILESIDAKDSYIYVDLFWKYFWHYWDEQNWLLASINMQKFIEYARPWLNKEWKGNAFSDMSFVKAYYLLGSTYFSGLKQYASAIESFQNCVSILEEKNLIEEFPDALSVYQRIWFGYESLNDYKESVEWHLKSLELARRLNGDTSDEFLYELSSLRYCYFDLDDFESAERVSLALITQIEKRDEVAGENFVSDSLYVKEYEQLITLCGAFSRYPELISHGLALGNLYYQRGEQRTESYLSLLDNMILAYHNTGDYSTESSLFAEYEDLSELLNKKGTDDYYNYLGLKAEALTFLYRLDEYNEVIEEIKDLTLRLYGHHSKQNLMQEFLVANQLMSLDNHSAAADHIQRCYDVLGSGLLSFDSQEDSLIILSNIHNLEGRIYMSSDPDKAEAVLKMAVDEMHAFGEVAFAPLDNLGLLFYTVKRDPRRALDYFTKAKEELDEKGDQTSINYVTILINIATCYQDLGLSGVAIAIYDTVQQAVLENYGKGHPIYATILQNKSLFYSRISDYSRAIQFGEEAKDCMASIYGIESEKYAVCLNNLAQYYQFVGRVEESKKGLREAASLLERQNPRLAVFAYVNLLNIYSYESNTEEFDSVFNRCNELISLNQLEDTDIAASFMGTVGYCLLSHESPKAKEYLGYALNITEKNGNTNSAQHLAGLIYYCLSLFLDKTQDESIIPVLSNVYKNSYLSNAALFNTKERESFVTNPTFTQVKDILFSARSNGNNDTQLFDYLLFNKGLLLGTSLAYAKAIYNSGNEELIGHYKELLDINRYLAGESVSHAKKYSLEEAQVQASILERQITLYLIQHGGYTDGLSYTYSDVKSSLDVGDLAVEFVSFLNHSDKTTYYAAMLAKSEWIEPKFIVLCKQEDLEKALSLSPDRIYGESAASESVYNLIWAPMAPYLKNIRTVYFAPAGYIYKLAIEHLYNGESRFDALYNVVRVSSTREICSHVPKQKYTSAVLYGGILYDEDDATMIAESRKIRGEQASSTELYRGFDASVTRKGWEYLPGTLEEVNQVSSIISKNKISSEVFTLGEGNEESFKALSGNVFSILHIATHGFYVTETQAERNDYYTSNPFVTQNTDSGISPLHRAGLMMAGGNKAWKGESVPDGVEDGILTAAEIASLDLNSCDVVVLSACETGLGEITDEGVLGLQRAFKNAGVNTIIMSLWEVDDQATSLMMRNFYSNLVKGKSKRESFNAAQKEVRKKYSDPRYWAAFIMLD